MRPIFVYDVRCADDLYTVAALGVDDAIATLQEQFGPLPQPIIEARLAMSPSIVAISSAAYEAQKGNAHE